MEWAETEPTTSERLPEVSQAVVLAWVGQPLQLTVALTTRLALESDTKEPEQVMQALNVVQIPC